MQAHQLASKLTSKPAYQKGAAVQTFTGYQASKVVNAELTKLGFKSIPAQMIYNYCSKGYIKTVQSNGQNLIEASSLASWLEAYVARKVSKAAAEQQA
jgi:hypothetical protein